MSEIEEVEVNGVSEEKLPSTAHNADNSDCERQTRRPDQDESVGIVTSSRVVREEIERIIEKHINEGSLSVDSNTLQQVTELLFHNRRYSSVRPSHCLFPINDMRDTDVSEEEGTLRCKLAALYRLIDLYGWSQLIYNHVTVRVSEELEHFLLNPFGLQYPEVTASSLLKVDMQGNVVDPGTTSFTFNRAGFVIHSAVHAARPDVHCCIHMHHPAIVAVSSMKCGLLPISQEAALLGDVSYHDYQGIVVDTKEREEIARDLGPKNHVMLLRNHGCMVVGRTIEEALFYLHNLVLACEAQVKLMPAGLDNIQIISEEARQKTRSIIEDNHKDVLGKPTPDNAADDNKDGVLGKFRVWDLEFEAQMRSLDYAGFRTGYPYRFPLLRSESPSQNSEAGIPLAASLYLDEDKWLSPLKKLMEGKKSEDKKRPNGENGTQH